MKARGEFASYHDRAKAERAQRVENKRRLKKQDRFGQSEQEDRRPRRDFDIS